MIESNFLDLKESWQQALLLPQVQGDHSKQKWSGLASQEAWQAAKGLAGWGGSPAENTAGSSWNTAHRKLKLKLPVHPQPAEIVLHPENKTDEKRVVERQGRSNHPVICEAWGKQAPMPCIPSPLDQGKIELNKANYVLLMLVFLLKIWYGQAQNIAIKRERLFKIGNPFSSVLSQWDAICIFSPLLLFWELFEQRKGNPGSRGKRKQQCREGKDNTKATKGNRQGSRRWKQFALKTRERRRVTGKALIYF